MKESVDPELFSEQEVVDLCISIGLCDESTVKKTTVSLRPYHFMRYMAVVVPNDPILKEMYKLLLYKRTLRLLYSLAMM